MVFKTITDYKELLSSYLAGQWPPTPRVKNIDWSVQKSDEEKAVLIGSIIVDNLRTVDFRGRHAVLNQLTALANAVEDANAKQRLRHFKQALRDCCGTGEILAKRSLEVAAAAKSPERVCESSESKVSSGSEAAGKAGIADRTEDSPGWKGAGWKDAILKVSKHRLESHFFRQVNYPNSAEYPLVTRDPGRFIALNSSSVLGCCAYVGSSFTTNRPHLIKATASHVLDAFDCAVTFDSKRRPSGLVIALGDGCGGHFGEEKQDQSIARAAYFSCKHTTRVLAMYDSPEQILREHVEIAATIATQVRQKVWGENTTLVCGKCFATPSEYRMVGFNIGDSMIVAWDPEAKSIINVAPAHVTESGTAEFPEPYQSFEIHPFDVNLPPQAIIIAMSDGVYDYLPQVVTESSYPNKLSYREVALDGARLNMQLTREYSNVQDLIEHLLEITVTQIELIRQQKISAEEVIQEGDDIAIVGQNLANLHMVEIERSSSDAEERPSRDNNCRIS